MTKKMHESCRLMSIKNGDFSYTDKKGYVHLFRKGKDLTKEIKTKQAHAINASGWFYEDMKGCWHIIHNDIEVAKGPLNKFIFDFKNGTIKEKIYK